MPFGLQHIHSKKNTLVLFNLLLYSDNAHDRSVTALLGKIVMQRRLLCRITETPMIPLRLILCVNCAQKYWNKTVI